MIMTLGHAGRTRRRIGAMTGTMGDQARDPRGARARTPAPGPPHLYGG